MSFRPVPSRRTKSRFCGDERRHVQSQVSTQFLVTRGRPVLCSMANKSDLDGWMDSVDKAWGPSQLLSKFIQPFLPSLSGCKFQKWCVPVQLHVYNLLQPHPQQKRVEQFLVWFIFNNDYWHLLPLFRFWIMHEPLSNLFLDIVQGSCDVQAAYMHMHMHIIFNYIDTNLCFPKQDLT